MWYEEREEDMEWAGCFYNFEHLHALNLEVATLLLELQGEEEKETHARVRMSLRCQAGFLDLWVVFDSQAGLGASRLQAGSQARKAWKACWNLQRLLDWGWVDVPSTMGRP